MSTYSQLPGVLNLRVKAGDDFATVIDFDADLNNHTVSSSIVSLVSGANLAPMTTTFENAGSGQVRIYLSDAETLSLAPGSYGWGISWVSPAGDKRNALGGILEVIR